MMNWKRKMRTYLPSCHAVPLCIYVQLLFLYFFIDFYGMLHLCSSPDFALVEDEGKIDRTSTHTVLLISLTGLLYG